MERTYGTGWEPTNRSCGRSKESHNGQSLGDLHDGGRECFKEARYKIVGCGPVGILVYWEMKIWEILWRGRGSI